MKTVLKLVIAVAILNAVVRGADAAWNYYQLKDAAQQTLLFSSPSTAAQIHAEILSAAVRLNVPLKAEDLLVRRQNGRTTASGSYKQSVEFFPNYLYPLSFSFVVDAVSLGGAPGDDEAPRRDR